MDGLGAGQVEEGLVDRNRLDERRRLAHQRAHLAADDTVFGHVRRDDRGVRTGLERLEHGHRRAHAIEAGDVAAGGDDAARAAADNDRLVGEARVVALFDTGVEGIAIEMRDGERAELAMADHARRAAIPAPLGDGSGIAVARLGSRAIAAQTVHAAGSGHSQAAPRTPLESP